MTSRSGVVGEHLLELVHDQQPARVLPGDRGGQRSQRVRARGDHARGVPGPGHRGHDAGPDQGRLPGTRRAHDQQQRELLESSHGLGDDGIAPEVEVGVLRVEGSQPPVRAGRARPADPVRHVQQRRVLRQDPRLELDQLLRRGPGRARRASCGPPGAARPAPRPAARCGTGRWPAAPSAAPGTAPGPPADGPQPRPRPPGPRPGAPRPGPPRPRGARRAAARPRIGPGPSPPAPGTADPATAPTPARTSWPRAAARSPRGTTGPGRPGARTRQCPAARPAARCGTHRPWSRSPRNPPRAAGASPTPARPCPTTSAAPRPTPRRPAPRPAPPAPVGHTGRSGPPDPGATRTRPCPPRWGPAAGSPHPRPTTSCPSPWSVGGPDGLVKAPDTEPIPHRGAPRYRP